MTIEERREYEDTIRTQWEMFDMTPKEVCDDILQSISTEVSGTTYNDILAKLKNEDVLKLDTVMRSANWC
jgi:hypothetical protein